MFIFGANYKNKILKARTPRNESFFKHASVREDGSVFFDIKLIKKACNVNNT